jgi:hypothetical protein
LKKFLGEDALAGLRNIEKLASNYGSNGYSVGSDLTWADLFIHEITFSLLNYQANILDNFELLQNIRKSVEKNEHLNQYLKTRPETPF